MKEKYMFDKLIELLKVYEEGKNKNLGMSR